MANITNGTFFSRNALFSARALKEFLPTKHLYSFLDELGNYIAVSAFIKGTIICRGMYNLYNLASESVASLLANTLLNCSVIFLVQNRILNFTIIWTFFAAFLCYKSRFFPTHTVARFVFSVTALCLAPIHFAIPGPIDYITEIFFIAYVGDYILRTFSEPIAHIIKDIFFVSTNMTVFLALEHASGTKGLNFILTGIFFLLSPWTFHAFIYRKLFLFLVITFIQSYCVYEKFLIYHNLSSNVTNVESNEVI